MDAAKVLVNRKVNYRLYPSAKQGHKMFEVLRLHQQLYNAALDERINAYKRCGISISFQDQCKSLTQVRAENPEYDNLNAQSEQVTLKRLDLAFKHFFRRVKEKAKQVGFPRFKSLQRFTGWGYKAHGDGWKYSAGKDFINGTLRLSGIGNIQIRGRARYRDEAKQSRDPGVPKNLEIIRKDDLWFASVTFETLAPFRESGEELLGVDWGTSKFLTIVNSEFEVKEIENPRYLKQVQEKLKSKQRAVSRKKKGSHNRKKAKKELTRCHRRLAWKREDFLHQTSARLIKTAKLIGTEELTVKNMTARGGVYKTGLNRSILDSSPGKFFQLMKYKAEEAGIFYVEAPTKKIKPSQTCCNCGDQVKKKLSEREHHCKVCGLICDRDVNAALVMLKYAHKQVLGQELALSMEKLRLRHATLLKCETPFIPQACFSSAKQAEDWVE